MVARGSMRTCPLPRPVPRLRSSLALASPSPSGCSRRTPAPADVVVDCLGGSVTVDQSIEQVTITGTCVDVVVSGSNSVVTMPARRP